MGLLRIIKQVRRQPRHVRDNIAFGVAASLTALVAAVWVYHAPGTFSGTDVATEDTSQPFFAQIRSSIGEQVGSLGEVFNAASSTLAEVAATTTDTSFVLTEENRRYMASSTTAISANSASSASEISATAETRRVVRIATTSASSSQTTQ